MSKPIDAFSLIFVSDPLLIQRLFGLEFHAFKDKFTIKVGLLQTPPPLPQTDRNWAREMLSCGLLEQLHVLV